MPDKSLNREIFVISDTHFNHENIIRYCNRPFSNAKEMNEIIVENWNKIVRPQDIVYHLGDVYMGGDKVETVKLLNNLNGRKRLILGNHDDAKDPVLTNAFQKIMVWRMFPEFGLLLTHIPVHPMTGIREEEGVTKSRMVNLHGHIHQKVVKDAYENITDEWYFNVCVEHTNYAPVNIEYLRIK